MAEDLCKVVAIEHLTLDGIYQAPARPDEDTRNGFGHGGWSVAGNDAKMQETISKYMTGGWSLLVGRITYEDLLEGWLVRQPFSPMTQALTNVQKFVASHKTDYELAWEHSTLLAGDATETVARLKKTHDKTLVIFGSGALVCSLMQRSLVNEFVLMFHPLVLGQGQHFFCEDAPYTKLKLSNEVITDTGIIIVTYQLAS